MNTAIEPRIKKMVVNGEAITAHLMDGRVVSVPLAWSWRLSDATPQQRNNFEITGNGRSVHWPDIDEDLSAHGMLVGAPARRPKVRVKSWSPDIDPATIPDQILLSERARRNARKRQSISAFPARSSVAQATPTRKRRRCGNSGGPWANKRV